jgi:hypothetical protein
MRSQRQEPLSRLGFPECASQEFVPGVPWATLDRMPRHFVYPDGPRVRRPELRGTLCWKWNRCQGGWYARSMSGTAEKRILERHA